MLVELKVVFSLLLVFTVHFTVTVHFKRAIKLLNCIAPNQPTIQPIPKTLKKHLLFKQVS